MALAPGRTAASVPQDKFAPVLFENTFDDGEAEPRALLARGDVGLDQTLPVPSGKAQAVVLHFETDVAHARDKARLDMPPHARLLGEPARDGLARVLQHIDQRLADHAGVGGKHLVVRLLQLHRKVWVGHALSEHGLTKQFRRIFLRKLGGGHPGEGGELIHHPPDIAHLADDSVGAAVKGFKIAGDLLAVFAAQPFGRKLDGGQRVLDLVRYPASHIAPGGVALGRDEAGDVVEGQYKPVRVGQTRAPAGAGSPRSRTTSTSVSASMTSVGMARCDYTGGDFGRRLG